MAKFFRENGVSAVRFLHMPFHGRLGFGDGRAKRATMGFSVDLTVSLAFVRVQAVLKVKRLFTNIALERLVFLLNAVGMFLFHVQGKLVHGRNCFIANSACEMRF